MSQNLGFVWYHMTPACYTCTSSCHSCCTSANGLGKAVEDDPSAWASLPPHKRLRWRHWLLALAWPGAGCCSHLDSETVDGRFISLAHSFKLNKSFILKCSKTSIILDYLFKSNILTLPQINSHLEEGKMKNFFFIYINWDFIFFTIHI